MTTISFWLKNIIMVVLFATFLELLLPNGSMQRFVRVIMGLFIMLAILNPVMGILEEYVMPGQVPALSTLSMEHDDISSKAKKLAVDRNKIASEMYKKELAQQIRATVLAVEGVQDATVEVEVESEGTFAGAIKKLIIYVKPITQEKQKIQIKATHAEETLLSPKLDAKITNTIAAFYQIKPNQIMVHSQ